MTVADAPVGDTETVAKRKAIYARFPAEYAAGARQAAAMDGEYPDGFHDRWTKDQRNAWFAGYNAGREKRLRTASRQPSSQTP
jgi:hypothetical protein